MAGGDVQIAIPNGEAPTTKLLVGQTPIVPKSVNATFDGSGVGGDFLPCLVITGREGFEVARIPAPQVAAGASAEVSWFPRVAAPAATAAAGIQFGGNPTPYTYGPSNIGGNLEVATRDKNGSGYGIELVANLGAGSALLETNDHNATIELLTHGTGGGILLTTDNNGSIAMGPGAGAFFVNSVGGVVSFQFGGGTKMGFFGAGPIVKPTVTGSRGGNAALASLLTQLANLGLITNSTTA